MTDKKKKLVKKGFTLIEILIAVSLFAIVATISSTIYIDIINLEKKSIVQEVFFEDGKIFLQQIANLIEAGAIDYEEYFSKYVIQEGENGHFGLYYGAYSSRFYDPGRRLNGQPSVNPDDLGVECSYPPDAKLDDCEIIFTLSTDLNTGQNPFRTDTSIPENSNAFCDNPSGLGGDCRDVFIGYVDELFLIDSTGTIKTIISKKKTGNLGDDDYAIGIVQLRGMDIDQNGVIDTWTCFDEYNCDSKNSIVEPETAIRLPSFSDLERPYDNKTSHFVPISPKRSTIKDLRFIISPVEDPYKAFNETMVQTHPIVTVIIVFGLSEEEKMNYPGEMPDIMLQGTYTAGVLSKINAYPPSKDLSWLKDIGLTKTP